MDATKLLENVNVVPVAVIEDKTTAVDLALTLLDAGIKAIEITLRTADALDAIELVANSVPEMTVGAGSIRQVAQLEEILNRGAQFAVSPGATEPLISKAKQLHMPFVPGAATASEILTLMNEGYMLQKFFPAEQLGGTQTLKALSAPLPEVRFFPTGGITAELAPQYLALECVTCIGGSWFIPKALLLERDFARIKEMSRSAVEITHV